MQYDDTNCASNGGQVCSTVVLDSALGPPAGLCLEDRPLDRLGEFCGSTHTHCTGDAGTNAKLSDEQINSVSDGGKVFKLISPRATYYMRSDNAYVDASPSMGLLPVQWSRSWDDGFQSGCDRVDSECVFGNTCERIFTDYSGAVGCYPGLGERCFNDGQPCGHTQIEVSAAESGPFEPFRWLALLMVTMLTPQDFELWVRSTGEPAAGSCAVGEAGTRTLSPAGLAPFTARCDDQGFMKALQLSSAYTPTENALSSCALVLE